MWGMKVGSIYLSQAYAVAVPIIPTVGRTDLLKMFGVLGFFFHAESTEQGCDKSVNRQ